MLRTSFIVGFPGETDAAFAALVDFVREQKFDRVGVFTYSREENTAAYGLADQVPEGVKRRRRAELMEVAAEISLEKNRGLVGREIEVMVEGAAPGARRGYARGPRPRRLKSTVWSCSAAKPSRANSSARVSSVRRPTTFTDGS